MANSRDDNWFRTTDMAVGAGPSNRVLDCSRVCAGASDEPEPEPDPEPVP